MNKLWNGQLLDCFQHDKLYWQVLPVVAVPWKYNDFRHTTWTYHKVFEKMSEKCGKNEGKNIFSPFWFLIKISLNEVGPPPHSLYGNVDITLSNNLTEFEHFNCGTDFQKNVFRNLLIIHLPLPPLPSFLTYLMHVHALTCVYGWLNV